MRDKIDKRWIFRGEPAAGTLEQSGRLFWFLFLRSALDHPLTSRGSGSQLQARRASSLIRVQFLLLLLRVKVRVLRGHLGRSSWVHSSVTRVKQTIQHKKTPKLNEIKYLSAFKYTAEAEITPRTNHVLLFPFQ